MKRMNDKRVRLIDSAAQLFLQQGINTTTLANIAELAKVPLGNVYYYFKSKESIILAVIEYRIKMLQQLFEEINADPAANNPKEKIKCLLKKLLIENESLIKIGDPIGSLCLELAKETTELHKSAIELMQTLISWCENQFKEIGSNLNSKQLAKYLVANIQGISLLAITFKDSAYLQEALNNLVNWVNSI